MVNYNVKYKLIFTYVTSNSLNIYSTLLDMWKKNHG